MDDHHLRESIDATRAQLKSAQRVIRTSLQFLADLDEQLANAQPNGRHSDGSSSNGRQTARGIIVRR